MISFFNCIFIANIIRPLTQQLTCFRTKNNNDYTLNFSLKILEAEYIRIINRNAVSIQLYEKMNSY